MHAVVPSRRTEEIIVVVHQWTCGAADDARVKFEVIVTKDPPRSLLVRGFARYRYRRLRIDLALTDLAQDIPELIR